MRSPEGSLGATWLVDLVGVDYFGHVTSVMLITPRRRRMQRSQRSGISLD